MRGSSIKRILFDADNPGPRPPGYLPLISSGQAVLASDIARGAADPAWCPPERLRGMCEAYVAVAGLSTMIGDEHDVAEVTRQAAADYAAWEAATAQIGQPDLTYYLRLTQEQEDAEQRMEKLTRDRGHALAEYQRQTGASLRQTAAAIREAGYSITPSGVSWLVTNSGAPLR